jgi:serine protease Do
MENTKKGEGVYETLFFHAFIISCFRDGFLMGLLTTSNLQQATCYAQRTTGKGQKSMKFIHAMTLLLILLVACSPAQASQRRSAVVVSVEKVSPAVVNISTVVQERVSPFFPFARDDFFKDFFPDLFTREYQRTSLGSGVVVDGKNGYIITNHHVIARASEIKVITSDQKEYLGRSLGSDPRSDLAVIKVDAAETLPEARLGDSEDLMIGETVIAIGNPFGLTHTVTTGVVSALDRSVRTEDRVYRHFIQTDASINPGNSGGPLLNIDGDVIGINTAIYQKAQGIGFAIPINKAKRIVRELLRAGEVRPPWVGLDLQELTQDLKAHFRVPEEKRGVLVADVYGDGPAAGAGFKKGDIILTLEDVPVSSPEEFYQIIGEYTVTETLAFKILRKGREVIVPVEAAPFPADLGPELFYRRLGIKISDRGREGQAGLVIEEVRKDSEAARVGLRGGDVILQINNRAMTGMDDFKEVVSRAHHLSSLNLVVKRGAYAYSLTLPF